MSGLPTIIMLRLTERGDWIATIERHTRGQYHRDSVCVPLETPRWATCAFLHGLRATSEPLGTLTFKAALLALYARLHSERPTRLGLWRLRDASLSADHAAMMPEHYRESLEARIVRDLTRWLFPNQESGALHAAIVRIESEGRSLASEHRRAA